MMVRSLQRYLNSRERILIMPKGLKKRIHVNQHNIKANAKHDGNKPVITVKTSKSNTYGHTVTIDGPSIVVYSPNKPLSCGAKVWMETTCPVLVWDDNLQQEKEIR
jgi:hypothetical protein